ncbi:MAG: hypothetical protein WAW80_00350 [Candidatus Saccharimonadales bacterium]
MSEKIPKSEYLSAASIARDIILRNGERVTDPEDGQDYTKANWYVPDTREVYDVTLLGTGMYSSQKFCLDIREWKSSDINRYVYNISENYVSYRDSKGSLYTGSQEIVLHAFMSWLKTTSAPEAVSYDSAGNEISLQQKFTGVAGYIAITSLLETDEGQRLLNHLAGTSDEQEIDDLHTEFYNLTRRQESSFYVGRLATKSILEPIVANQRLRRQKGLTQRPHTQKDNKQS